MSSLTFLFPAFLACLVLTGIHTYLGIHVITRGVIFVDIALAQIAALGMVVALWLGLPHESGAVYLFGLGFTSLGALFFAYFRDDRLPQEAIVGVSFAVSSALAIWVANGLPHGSEHIQEILSGNILWVTGPQIFKTAILYGLLGYFHYRFREKFLLVSADPAQARRQGLRLWLWDLLFYLSFGVVITSSVQMAGILLVFSFLIVPALCSMIFFKGLRARILLGWGIGAATSLAGITASYAWDLPTGPAIVAGFGVSLALCLLVKGMWGLRPVTHR